MTKLDKLLLKQTNITLDKDEYSKNSLDELVELYDNIKRDDDDVPEWVLSHILAGIRFKYMENLIYTTRH